MIASPARFRPFRAPAVFLIAVASGSACSLQVSVGDPCAAPVNEIVAENCLEGHPPTEWDINSYGDPSIQGFGTDIAIAQGETIEFKIDTDSDDYRIDIYRMGYYSGMGARRVGSFEPSVTLPQIQPECLRGPIPVLAEGGGMEDWPAPLVDCGNWAVSASWRAPEDATSGIYFARLVREDPLEGWVKNDQFGATPLPPTGEDSLWEAPGFKAVMRNGLREPRASHVYFVVRDDDGESDMLFQTSDLTWQAYNRYGGHSVYGATESGASAGSTEDEPRAPKVSYNRPFETRHYRAVNMVFNSEYPMVRWLERNGYDVSYSSGIDTQRRGEEPARAQESSSPSDTTSTGPDSSDGTSRRLAPPACTSPSSARTRSTGRCAGRRASTDQACRTGPSSHTRTRRTTGDSTQWNGRENSGTTVRSTPRARGRRTRSRGRCSR